MITTLYEPFRHWSDGGSVYILSDLHFSDSDCKLMDPNWITPEEQLDIINGMVGKGDTFVCLGDVGDPKFVPMIKARKKILVLENHDARGAYKDLRLPIPKMGYPQFGLEFDKKRHVER